MPAPIHPSQQERVIYLNDAVRNSAVRYLHNGLIILVFIILSGISTTKYNFLTFIPKFLFTQFRIYANLFFLFIACIQQIPDISPTNRFGTVIPLSLVLFFSAMKERIEDSKRASADHQVNTKSVKVLSNGGYFADKQWRRVVVGDIVRIENCEFFPADLILLSSSEPDALCYIETSNLDGYCLICMTLNTLIERQI
jgi:phospholipid-transporting ATPase